MIEVRRPINGISLNGTESLLSDDGDVMFFESVTEAKRYLAAHGVPEEELDDFLYVEVQA